MPILRKMKIFNLLTKGKTNFISNVCVDTHTLIEKLGSDAFLKNLLGQVPTPLNDFCKIDCVSSDLFVTEILRGASEFFFDVRINFILILFDSLNVCLVNSAVFIEPFGNLVFVCRDAFHCYGQSTQFRHIEVDDKSVNCRFAEIGAHILRAKSVIFYFIKSSSLVSTKNFTCIGRRWFRLSSSMLLHCQMIQFKQFFLKFLVQSLLNEFLLYSCDKANVTE